MLEELKSDLISGFFDNSDDCNCPHSITLVDENKKKFEEDDESNDEMFSISKNKITMK